MVIAPTPAGHLMKGVPIGPWRVSRNRFLSKDFVGENEDIEGKWNFEWLVWKL